MLPEKYFEKDKLLSKEPIKANKYLDVRKTEKLIEINENTIANSSKTSIDDDDYRAYDDENYDYDSESTELVNATAKPVISSSNFSF